MPVYIPPADLLTPLAEEWQDPQQIEEQYRNQSFCYIPPKAQRSTKQTYSTSAGAAILRSQQRETFLWRYLDATTSWQAQFQRRGTCVGQCGKLCADIISAINHKVYDQPWLGRAAVAPVYAGGRVDIAGKTGSWDGSTNDWASKWLTEFGVVQLKDMSLDENDLTNDERLAVRWTASRAGVPTEFEDHAVDNPVKTRRRITNAREAGASIEAGNLVMSASVLIPDGRRNAQGFSRVRRSGGHSVAIIGVRYNPFGLLYMNSWGVNWGSGPKYPEDQPDGSVWLTEADSNAMIRSGDWWALIGMGGYEQLPSDKVVL